MLEGLQARQVWMVVLGVLAQIASTGWAEVVVVATAVEPREAREVREEYQVEVGVLVGKGRRGLVTELVEPEVVGRYAFGPGNLECNVGNLSAIGLNHQDFRHE